MADYQWYPGHMTKAKRMMQENIKLVDLIIEIVDARIPLSSRNPDIDGLAAGKSRIMLMSKADLADPERTKAFCKYYEGKGFQVVALDARTRKANEQIRASVQKACQAKIERDRKRGIVGRPLRAMVVGIPNVGKSTFINSFAGRASAKTGNKPGVTKGKQWIRLNKNLDLLDTPGILWPKFEDQQVGIRLALVSAIREELLDTGDVAIRLIDYLKENYPGMLTDRYQVDESPESRELLQKIAEKRGCLMKGSQIDYEKAGKLVLDDFRSLRIGRITLELPDGEPAES